MLQMFVPAVNYYRIADFTNVQAPLFEGFDAIKYFVFVDTPVLFIRQTTLYDLL